VSKCVICVRAYPDPLRSREIHCSVFCGGYCGKAPVLVEVKYAFIPGYTYMSVGVQSLFVLSFFVRGERTDPAGRH